MAASDDLDIREGADPGGGEDRRGERSWTFLTNHAHVLLCIARDPTIRLRDVADRVGITERAAQSIVADLVEGEYLSRERVGRRNQYELHYDRPLRHPVEREHDIGELVQLLTSAEVETAPPRRSPAG
jgi:hypothetical protein